MLRQQQTGEPTTSLICALSSLEPLKTLDREMKLLDEQNEGAWMLKGEFTNVAWG